jgi:hypothetical protein
MQTATMELTKSERQTLLLAVGVALDKENQALQSLQSQVRTLGINAAIEARIKHVAELDRLRGRLSGI